MALMMGAIGAVGGLILALIYTPLMGAVLANTGYPQAGGFYGIFAAIMVVGFPIMLFIVGFIEGAIIALVYNFLAPRIGGIRVSIKEDKAPPPLPTMTPQPPQS